MKDNLARMIVRAMKLFILLLLITSGWAQNKSGAQEVSYSDEEVSKILEELKGQGSDQRLMAVNRLASLIILRRGSIGGYSDTPTEPPEPKVAKKVSDAGFDTIVTALGKASHDPDGKVREAAARAFCGIEEKPPVVSRAMADALKQQEDATVVWYVCQAMWKKQPDAAMVVPPMIALLKKEGSRARQHVAMTLRYFGPNAKEAIPALVEIVESESDEITRLFAIQALAHIGLDKKGAESLSNMRIPEKGPGKADLFAALIHQPPLAIKFLENNPGLLGNMNHNPDLFIDLINRSDPAYKELKEILLDRPDLPSIVMAYTRDPRYLPTLKNRMKEAGEYDLHLLKACARACGGPADKTIVLSEKDQGDFKPNSAWPGSDDSRKGDGRGHGDGFTLILITGYLLMEDGRPATEPTFTNVNDRMLMGRRKNALAPLSYDPGSGRFAFPTTVFAAYSMGKEAAKRGPYQTGSAQVRIDAKGAKSLTVQFYDEMPDVKITLPMVK